MIDITTAGSRTISVSEIAICIGTLRAVGVAVIPAPDDDGVAARAPQLIELEAAARRQNRNIRLVVRSRYDAVQRGGFEDIATIGRQADKQNPVGQADQVY